VGLLVSTFDGFNFDAFLDDLPSFIEQVDPSMMVGDVVLLFCGTLTLLRCPFLWLPVKVLIPNF
jgi:hypothetical protein